MEWIGVVNEVGGSIVRDGYVYADVFRVEDELRIVQAKIL
jgi:hypothetical protein